MYPFKKSIDLFKHLTERLFCEKTFLITYFPKLYEATSHKPFL